MTDRELFGNSEQLDTISRAEAIETVRKAKSIGQAHRMLVQLPSAEPDITLESAIDYLHSIGWMQEHDRILTEFAQRWIPVTERLPDAGEYYFVTVQYGWNCTEIDVAKYELDGWRSCHNVLAWRPLPEPWKGDTP